MHIRLCDNKSINVFSFVEAEIVLSCVIWNIGLLLGSIHHGYMWGRYNTCLGVVDSTWYVGNVVRVFMFLVSSRLICNLICSLLCIIMFVLWLVILLLFGHFSFLVVEEVVTEWVADKGYYGCSSLRATICGVILSVICMSLVSVMVVYGIKYSIF